MIVVDANVLVYANIVGERTSLALRVQELDDVWRVPPLWRSEFTSALLKYLRQGEMELGEAESILATVVAAMIPAEQAPDPCGALRAALRFGISGYDAQYLSLARELGVKCISEDQRLKQAAPDDVMSMAEFCGRTEG